MGVTIEFKNIDPKLIERIDNCPYCQEYQSKYIFTENGFPYFECLSCQLIFLQTRLKEENLGILYNDQTYHKPQISQYHFFVARRRLEMFRNLPKEARIHEDGAGIGNFVAEAKKRGYQVTGSDLGADSVSKAKELCDVSLFQGKIQDLGIKFETLDGFAAFNLFSHLYSPWNYISYVSSLLKPGGQFLTLTANRLGFFRYLYKGRWGAPEHVYHFNVPLIRKFLATAGLECVMVKPAFDSDFPYLFYETSRNSTGLKKKITSGICRGSIRAWNLLSLPKDDVYILAKKPRH